MTIKHQAHHLDKPIEALQPKTSLETPRDLAMGQANQEIQPFCEWRAFVCVSARDRKLSND